MRKGIVLCLCVLLFVLSGCSPTSLSIDTAMVPPAFSDDQGEIYKALQAELSGISFELKYPISGKYMSAFIKASIDSEPDEEVIAFYQEKPQSSKNTTEISGGVSLCVLDKDNRGKWKVACNMSGEKLAGKDQVLFSDINEVMFWEDEINNEIYIIVGFRGLAASGNILKVYQYNHNELAEIYSSPYLLMDQYSATKGSRKRLFFISPGTPLGPESVEETANNNSDLSKTPIKLLTSPAKANLLVMENGFPVLKSEVELDVDVAEYRGITTGKTGDGEVAFFVDGMMESSLFSTQIITLKDNVLSDFFEGADPKTASPAYKDTFRIRRPLCMDYDQDGQVEIPEVFVAKGYENQDADQQRFFTKWKMMAKGWVEDKAVSYVNATGGYIFILPGSWVDSVTVKADSTGTEVLFYAYKGYVEDNSEKLLSILKATNEQEVSNAKDDGYELIRKKNQISYMIKTYPEVDNELKNDIPGREDWPKSFILTW